MTRVPRPRGWRVVGWLLTPFVVWAASFFGGWIGVVWGDTLQALVVGAVAGGVVGAAIWVLVGGARRSALGPRQGEGPSAEGQGPRPENDAPGAEGRAGAGRGPSGG